MRRLTRHLRFWMLGVLVAAMAMLELLSGLPGWWSLGVYGAAFAFFGVVMFALIDREGRPMGDRTQLNPRNDMHGHYR